MLNNSKSQQSRGKIKVSKNGPYIVSNGIPLSRKTIGINAEGDSCKWLDGEKYPSQQSYALCRCGHSKTKPFCDGTHLEINFNGTETSSRQPYLDQAEKIIGPVLDLTDASELCAAARFCDRAGGVWRLTQTSDDPEAKKIAVEEAGNCPSGRLVVWGKDGKAVEPSYNKSIVIVEDPQEDMKGPIWVRGGIPVISADGVNYEIRNRVALCRCGKSLNKPFCDGNHCT